MLEKKNKKKGERKKKEKKEKKRKTFNCEVKKRTSGPRQSYRKKTSH